MTAPMRTNWTVISAMIGQLDRAIGNIDALFKGEVVRKKSAGSECTYAADVAETCN